MATSRSSSKPQGRKALNPQQQQAFTSTKARPTAPGNTGVGATSPQIGPRTNWAEVEAKVQEGMRRSDTPQSPEAPSETQVRDQMRKANRGRATGRSMARPGLTARKSAHAGVSNRHQSGTT